MAVNQLLLDMAKQKTGLTKTAFIPAPGQDPAAAAGGGAPPPPGGAPAAGGMAPPPPGGAPPMPGMPPGAPPPMGDPAAMGGAPPLDPMAGGGIQGIIQQTVQAMMQQGAGGKPGAGGKGAKQDETANQMYKLNVMVMAIITGLNNAGIQVVIPPESMLGPPPGSDPAMAMQAANTVPQPGQDPNAAAAGGAPGGQQPGMLNFMPGLAPPPAPAGGAPAPGGEQKTAAEDLGELVAPSGRSYDPSLAKTANLPLVPELYDILGIQAPEHSIPQSTSANAAAVLALIESVRESR